MSRAPLPVFTGIGRFKAHSFRLAHEALPIKYRDVTRSVTYLERSESDVVIFCKSAELGLRVLLSGLPTPLGTGIKVRVRTAFLSDRQVQDVSAIKTPSRSSGRGRQQKH